MEKEKKHLEAENYFWKSDAILHSFSLKISFVAFCFVINSG
jgi:hypothetical protein